MRHRWFLWMCLAAMIGLLAGCARPGEVSEPAGAPSAEASQPSASGAPAGEALEDSDSSADRTALTPQQVRDRLQAEPDAVYLFAVNVGKGDALILRVRDTLCLIDTGKVWARGQLGRALAMMDPSASSRDGFHLDAIFLSHTDDDHVGGLQWMIDDGSGAPAGRAEALYASAMYTGVKEEKHPAIAAAQALTSSGEQAPALQWLRRGDAIPLGSTGAVLRVLAPESLYKDKDDNNSLVMLLESDQGRILFTGDMELPEEAELLGFGDDLKCDVLKVANHGDDDTTSAAFANAAAAQLALISTDSRQKPGTPDPGVVSRLSAAGSRVWVTQDCELGLLVTLKGGAASATPVDCGEPPASGLSIVALEAEDDRILLGNSGDASLPLGGYYLYSDRGDELFTFPEGCEIAPGQTLTVGTASTKGDYDLLWADKKVIHRKKTDVLYLYDPFGRIVDWRENGIE